MALWRYGLWGLASFHSAVHFFLVNLGGSVQENWDGDRKQARITHGFERFPKWLLKETLKKKSILESEWEHFCFCPIFLSILINISHFFLSFTIHQLFWIFFFLSVCLFLPLCFCFSLLPFSLVLAMSLNKLTVSSQFKHAATLGTWSQMRLRTSTNFWKRKWEVS